MVRPHQHSLCQSVSQPQSSSLSLLVSSSVSSSSLLLLFLKSYILPLFDYCDVVWSGCTKSEASRLETLLNYACHTVLHKCVIVVEVAELEAELLTLRYAQCYVRVHTRASFSYPKS